MSHCFFLQRHNSQLGHTPGVGGTPLPPKREAPSTGHQHNGKQLSAARVTHAADMQLYLPKSEGQMLNDNEVNFIICTAWQLCISPRTPTPVQALGCRCRMEQYFRSVKSLRVANKSSCNGGERPSPSRSSSPSIVEQDEEDTLLWVENGEDGQRVTCWRPESPYSLVGEEEKFVPAQHVVMDVPQGTTRDAEGGWSLQPIALKEYRHTSLRVLVPGYPLEGVLFSTHHHPREGQVTLQLDFPTAIDYLRNFFETGIHLLEVVQDETHATTRFLVGSWQDPRMPHLPFYTPRKPGGPWFRDINGNHSFLQTVRSFRTADCLPHDLEFFFSVSSEQRTHLEELCSETRGDPQEAGDE